MKPKSTGLAAMWIVCALFTVVEMVACGAFAQKAPPRAQDKIALGESEVKQLLLLMDTDKNGKVSKQEWMKFMEAEFDRLDKDKSGELDPKEVAESRIEASRPFSAVGK